MVHLYYLFALFEVKINLIEDVDRICNFDLIQDIYMLRNMTTDKKILTYNDHGHIIFISKQLK